ncbi:MAG: DUF1501 domain-containing protein [Planctomyces sp.]
MTPEAVRMRWDHSSAAFQRQSRRSLLRSAACGFPGLSLSGLLQARSLAAEPSASKSEISPIRSCILIFYYGGPSHLDTYDLKPEAPVDIRGEFRPISTSVPGLSVCEHLPRMAARMHKVALIRSMHHGNRLHDSASTEALTGRPSPNGDREEFAPIEQFFPCYGSALTALRPRSVGDVSHAALPFVFRNVIEVPCQGGGFLGKAYDPLQVLVDPDQQLYQIGSMTPLQDLSRTRIADRRHLLEAMDPSSTSLSTTDGLRRYYDQAYRLLTSESLHQALDLSREPAEVRHRYGFGPGPSAIGSGGGGGNGAEMAWGRQMRGQNLLLARRLVEAGVPFVNVYDCRQQGQNWDAHHQNFSQHRDFLLPLADQSLAALIDDLDDRGLLESTLVVAMGEFGRTPRINTLGGRDHWPDCYTVLLAGGGVRGGTVYGASDRTGAFPAENPVTPADLAATIFWRFGVSPSTEIHDLTGRPWRVADGQPVSQLFS